MPVDEGARVFRTTVGPESAVVALGHGDIDRDRYTSPDYFRAEMSRLWPRVWLAAGPVSDAPEPGCYFTFELGGDSVLIVRQPEGIRAFHNVCRHRGRRLREPGRGRAASFQCPYHAWEYSIDGSLQHVPRADCFPGLAPETLGLAPIACEEFAGQAWIRLSPDGPTLREFLGEVWPLLDAYRLQDYTLFTDQSVEIGCNWKLAVDAFNEGYHTSILHPEIRNISDGVPLSIDLLGPHFRAINTMFMETQSAGKPARFSESWMLQEAGLPPADAAEPLALIRLKIQRRLRERSEFALAALTDDQLTDRHSFFIFPNVQLGIYWSRMYLIRHRPHPIDPGRMIFDQQFYRRRPRGELAARPPHEQFAWGEGSMGRVTDQDLANLLRVQQGMQSTACPDMTLGAQEIGLRQMHRALDGYMGAS